MYYSFKIIKISVKINKSDNINNDDYVLQFNLYVFTVRISNTKDKKK